MRPPEPPALPPELTAVLSRLRLPYIRRAAPEVLATARAQRWDPAETLRVLLVEEAAGRDAATKATRRRAAGFPSGKTLDGWWADGVPKRGSGGVLAWGNSATSSALISPGRPPHRRVRAPKSAPRPSKSRACGWAWRAQRTAPVTTPFVS